MKKLAEIILSLLNLFEAEGRLLRFRALATLRNAGFLFLGILFFFAALVFFLCSFYQFLIQYFNPSATLLMMGLTSSLIAFPLLWLPCRSQMKKRKK